MKAIILTAAGGPENLQVTDLPVPQLTDDEILVEVKAIGINPVDTKVRKSQDSIDFFFKGEKPVILGWDVSGVVTETHHSNSSFKKGDEVFGMVNFPGKGRAYAGYVAAPAMQLALKPANISHQEAAAASLAALTAWQTLVSTAKTKTGDKVLIHGASGGVGHYAVQIAKYLGAYVIGTSSAANKDFVLSLGADEHIDYKTQRFEDLLSDIDVVLDYVGGNSERSLKITKPGGYILTIPEKVPDEVASQAKQKGINTVSFKVKSNGNDMKQLAGLFQKGQLRSHISKTFSFADIAAAHREMETGRTIGKIVVTV